MDTVDWRSELTPATRDRIINKIMEILKRHLPFSGPEGISELRRIAIRFEERILNTALNEIDYLQKISMKTLTLDTKLQTADDFPSTSSLVLAINNLPLDHLDNADSSLTNVEQVINTTDWRSQLPPDTRQKHFNELMETLKTHVPYSGQEGLDELMRIVISFEELMFNTDIDQDSLSSLIILFWMI